jgi:hypothetical protein
MTGQPQVCARPSPSSTAIAHHGISSGSGFQSGRGIASPSLQSIARLETLRGAQGQADDVARWRGADPGVRLHLLAGGTTFRGSSGSSAGASRVQRATWVAVCTAARQQKLSQGTSSSLGFDMYRRSCARKAADESPAPVWPIAITTDRRATAGGAPPLPPDVTNAASISSHNIPSGLALQRATMASSRAAPKAPKNGVPVPYFHVVFTLPAAIADLAYQNKAVIYDALFKASSEALLTIAADPKHLGARIGVTAVLHTWGSAMTHHPHVHMIVPGGGIALDGSKWVACKPGFFLPVRVLSKLFRRLMLEKLAMAHATGKLQFFGERAHLAAADAFAAFLAPLKTTRWFVYSKRPFAGPQAVLAYLARYTHRVASYLSTGRHPKPFTQADIRPVPFEQVFTRLPHTSRRRRCGPVLSELRVGDFLVLTREAPSGLPSSGATLTASPSCVARLVVGRAKILDDHKVAAAHERGLVSPH